MHRYRDRDHARPNRSDLRFCARRSTQNEGNETKQEHIQKLKEKIKCMLILLVSSFLMPPLPPFSLAITPSMMLSDYYQKSFAQERFLHTFDNISPHTTATLAQLKQNRVPEYVILLRLTNWLLFAEHQLRLHPNIINMDESGMSTKEYKTYIRDIVYGIQRIVSQHCDRNDPKYDTSYATRHERFIAEMLAKGTVRFGGWFANPKSNINARVSGNVCCKSRRVIRRKPTTKTKVRPRLLSSSILRSRI